MKGLSSRKDVRSGSHGDWNERWTGALIVLVVLLAGTNGMSVEEGLDWDGDAALYILHARNIVEGRSYENTGYVYNSKYPSLSPRSYAPGYPIVLAPIYAMLGVDTVAMKWASVTFFAGALFTFALLLRFRIPPAWTLAGVAVFGLNPEVRLVGRQVSSDMAFLFFALATLFAIMHFDRARASNLHVGFGVGILCYFAYATRTVGLTLVVGFLLFDRIRHRRITRAFVGAAVIFSTGVFLQSTFASGVGTYLDQFVPTFESIQNNLIGYAREASVIWDSGGLDSVRKVCFVLTGGLAALGVLHGIRVGLTVTEVFALLYALIILLWPAFQGFRFILPLLALFILYGLMGMRELSGALPTSIGRGVIVVLALTMAGTVGLRYGQGDLPDEGPFANDREAAALFDWIQSELSEDAVLVFVKPRVLSLMTNRASLANHHPEEDQEMISFLGVSRATHLVLGPPWLMPERRRWLERFIQRHPDLVSQVYDGRDFTVYALM